LREELNQVPERLKGVGERLKDVPDRLKDVPDRLRAAPEKLQARSAEVGRKLKSGVLDLRDETEERAWELQKRALETAGDLLERVAEVPVVSSVAPRVEGVVQDRLEHITRPPIDDYDDLNVKAVRVAMSGLDRIDLLKVARYEEAHKARKTVLRDVEAELKRRRVEAEADYE